MDKFLEPPITEEERAYRQYLEPVDALTPVDEKFAEWYEKSKAFMTRFAKETPKEMQDSIALSVARKFGHGAVGWLVGRWTAGVADMPVSTTGKLYSRDKLRNKIEDLGIEVTETGAPEAGPSRALLPGSKSLKDPVWQLKDTYGNIKTISPDKVTEGTYSRDWGEVYAGLVGTEVTPEMQSVYQVGKFIGSLKPTSKVVQAVTGKIPARPGLLKTAQAGWIGMTADSLGQVEDIVAGKRDSFSFKEAHQTGAIFTAFGGVIEGVKATVGAVSDAYMINRFMKAHPEALNVLSKKDIRTLGNYGRAIRNGMSREASLKVFGKKVRPIWEKLDKFRSDIEYKPPMPKLLPEKAGLSVKPEVLKAKPTQVTKPPSVKDVILYRGHDASTSPLEANKYTELGGTSLTTDKNYAAVWLENLPNPIIGKYKLKSNAKVLIPSDELIKKKDAEWEKLRDAAYAKDSSIEPYAIPSPLVDYARAKGYDAIDLRVRYGGEQLIILVNPNAIEQIGVIDDPQELELFHAEPGYEDLLEPPLKEFAEEPKNIYLKMPLERVQSDAAEGVSLAKEALIRMNPDATLGQDLLEKPTRAQFAKVHQLKAKHNLTNEEYREALKYSTGIDSMANMSRYDADLAMQHMQNFDDMVGMIDAVAKSESVMIDPSIPNLAKIRKAAGSDEVFHRTLLYSNKIGGVIDNADVPDLEWRQKKHAQNLVNTARVMRRAQRKTAAKEEKPREYNALSVWSSSRYALAQASLRSGASIRTHHRDMQAAVVDMKFENKKNFDARLKRAEAPRFGQALTYKEGLQVAEWLYTSSAESPDLKEQLWATMPQKVQKIAEEMQGFLQNESANLVRWKRWLLWNDATLRADSQIEKLRDKGVKITGKRLSRIMKGVKKARPINAPQDALRMGRIAQERGELRNYLDSETWGTIKEYFMSQQELTDLTGMYPTDVILEEIGESANRMGNAPELNVPSTMTREGKAKILKTGNILSAILNHADQVGISAATHQPLKNLWENFASTDPSVRDIASMRTLINSTLGRHHHVEDWVKLGRAVNNATWRAILGLSPKRALWFAYRNAPHQNIAYGLSQTGLKELSISAKQISLATTKAMFTGSWSDNVDKVNPWIREDYENHFEASVSQEKQLHNSMMLQREEIIYKDMGNKAMAVVDAIGSAPVYSDRVNRLAIWPNLHQTAYRNVQKFVRGEIDGKAFWNNLDLDTLHLDERLEFDHLINQGRWRELVKLYAEYKTENIHFRYATPLRSIGEQTPSSRLIKGLLTFPRGTFEIMYQNGYKPFVQGFESGNYKQSYEGFKTILITTIMSRAARRLLFAVTGVSGAYGVFDTVFRYSPLAPGIKRIADLFDATSDAIYLAEKNNEDIPTTVDRVLSQVVYQAELFIPMCDVLINRYKAQNDVYGVRLYSLLKKKAVQRYRDEEGKVFRKADRSTTEKYQMLIWGGAEKGKALKEETD